MTYQYLYQTKENENRRGEIKARNRAEAYAALRRRGIRPYRLIGDDPVNWRPWAVSGAILALVVALCIALELNMDQTRDLLSRAGYALSPSSLSDVIISYFIENRQYDIFEINAVLFQYDQSPLGAKG